MSMDHDDARRQRGAAALAAINGLGVAREVFRERGVTSGAGSP